MSYPSTGSYGDSSLVVSTQVSCDSLYTPVCLQFFKAVYTGLIYVKCSYKGKGQVPLYRIHRHSITPWGPLEGQGRQHFSLATAALIPGRVLDRRLGSQEHPHLAPVSAPASAAVCPVTLLL